LALRVLGKSRVFCVTAVAILALGIGVNTTVFGVVNAIVFRPLAVKDGGRLEVIATLRARSPTLGPVSFPDLQDYRAATHELFDDIAGYSVGFMGLAYEGGAPARLLVDWVTGNYFALLGIRPALGRLIHEDEGSPGHSAPVAVLGYSTWLRRFGGDRSIIGQKVRLNGQPCTIIGVVPEDFRGTFAFSEAEVYLPVNWTNRSLLDDRSFRSLHSLARLRPGISIESAQAALDVVAGRLGREYPADDSGVRLKVVAERLARPEEDNARSNGFGAAAMLGLVELVLLVAMMSVANLFLTRVAGRRRELAIRLALGAGRGRIVRQLLTEFAILVASGGVAGFGVAAWVWRLLAIVRLPGDLPIRLDFQVDGRVMAYALVATTLTALLVGLVASRVESHQNVIGVTQTGKYRFLFENPQPYYYVPIAQEYAAMRVLHVRTAASPEVLAPAIEREIHRIQPELPVYDVQTMKNALEGGYGLFTVRTGALFAAILAFIALSLAVIGLYGVVSHMANQRTHEFAIRIAVGASRTAIAAAVIRSGVILILSGTTIGLAGAWGLTRFLSGLLFQVPPLDFMSFAAAFVCVAVVTVTAMSIPAHKATRVDPIAALRSE
jgi:ABC-type antimicrobial peptide transport system permease subunit